MLLEDTRGIHEDLERLEAAIADRVAEEPRNVSTRASYRKTMKLTFAQIRERLDRDHQAAKFLTRIEEQSKRLQDIYADTEARTREVQAIATGDPFDEFYKQLGSIKDFHRRYPNEQVENLERAYKRKIPAEGESATAEVDAMFTGEEAWGKFFDLTTLHEEYLNQPDVNGVRRVNYIQYLDIFDQFALPACPVTKANKRKDQWFKYVGRLALYLEDFMNRTRPLEPLNQLYKAIDEDFEKAWSAGEVPGWGAEVAAAPTTEGTGEGIWCPDCQKEFKNDNVYKSHLTGKKHIKAAEARKNEGSNGAIEAGGPDAPVSSLQRLKDRAVAEREYRIMRLTQAMSTTKSDTRVNVERKQGMTEKERQQELEALFAMNAPGAAAAAEDSDDEDGEEKIYNPLKLPLAWDGRPIPYWLYKLHGLGVEFPCEICGNFVYMGRRAFDKHFGEGRHVYGLKCLGITNTSMFREITRIEEALKLWDKLQRDKNSETKKGENVVEMEDAEGHVMPERVYYDLQKQGLL